MALTGNRTLTDFFHLTVLCNVLLSDVFVLACHPQANFVVTAFLTWAPQGLSEHFITALLPHAQHLSHDKCGYRVASTMFQKFGPILMQEFFQRLNLKALILNRYGNFVAI